MIETLKYHFRESVWRSKKIVRSTLERVSRRPAPATCTDDPTIVYGHRRLASARDRLLLRDYEPTSMARLPRTDVSEARYPVIDVHCHLNDGIVMTKSVDPKQFLRVMDETNVKSTVNLTGGWGQKLRNWLNNMGQRFPGRFYAFCQIDYSRIDDSKYLVETIDEAHELGAKGVKVLKDLGLTVRDRSGKVVRIDDPRLDCVWERAGQLGMPVGIHTADPDAFFQRIDRHNERYQELIVHPDWGYFGRGFASKEELLEQRNRVFAKHPGTQFWGLHMANRDENLDEVSEWMERYPNLMLELGGRIAELGRQPRRAARFITRYQDRVMFGMDTKLTSDAYRTYFRFLETEDEYFEYPGYPWQGSWKIYGLNLADRVLRKVYYDNAARELGLPTLESETEPAVAVLA